MLTLNGKTVFHCARYWRPYEGRRNHRSIRAEISERDEPGITGYTLIATDANNQADALGLYGVDTGNSLEASVAANASGDGFYILEQDASSDGGERQVAMVVIDNGAVVAGSGLIGAPDFIREEMESMRAMTFLEDDASQHPVYVSAPWVAEALGTPEAAVVALPELLARDGRVAITSLAERKAGPLALATMLLAVVAVLAGGGYYTYITVFPEDKRPGLTAEQRQAKQRERFIAEQRQALNRVLPTSNSWVARTTDALNARYGRSTMGWDYGGFDCTVGGGCTVIWYGLGEVAPIAPLAAILDVPADSFELSVQRNGVLNLNIPANALDLPDYKTFSPAETRALPSVQARGRTWWEFRQVQKLRLPLVEIRQPEQMRKLVAAPTPPGVPVVVYRGKAAMRGAQVVSIDVMTDALDSIPARATRLTYATGAGGDEPGWKIEVAYVGQK